MLEVNLPNREDPSKPLTGMEEGTVQLHIYKKILSVRQGDHAGRSCPFSKEKAGSRARPGGNVPDGAQDEDQGVALQPVAVEAFGAVVASQT